MAYWVFTGMANCTRSLQGVFLTLIKSLCCLHTDPGLKTKQNKPSGFCYKEIYDLGEQEVVIEDRTGVTRMGNPGQQRPFAKPSIHRIQMALGVLTLSVPTRTHKGTVAQANSALLVAIVLLAGTLYHPASGKDSFEWKHINLIPFNPKEMELIITIVFIAIS